MKREIWGGANTHLTVFVVIDAYLCSASAVIFLAPISAFDQVSHSLRMIRQVLMPYLR